MPAQSMESSRIVSAISTLRDGKGATATDVVSYLREKHGVACHTRNMVVRVRSALCRAVASGLLIVRRGRYRKRMPKRCSIRSATCTAQQAKFGKHPSTKEVTERAIRRAAKREHSRRQLKHEAGHQLSKLRSSTTCLRYGKDGLCESPGCSRDTIPPSGDTMSSADGNVECQPTYREVAEEAAAITQQQLEVVAEPTSFGHQVCADIPALEMSVLPEIHEEEESDIFMDLSEEHLNMIDDVMRSGTILPSTDPQQSQQDGDSEDIRLSHFLLGMGNTDGLGQQRTEDDTNALSHSVIEEGTVTDLGMDGIYFQSVLGCSLGDSGLPPSSSSDAAHNLMGDW